MRKKAILPEIELLNRDFSALEGILSFSGQQKQMLTFQVEQEIYGIEIQKIKELVRYYPDRPPKPVPNVPSDIIGVINVRGEIIPVMDLRKKTGLPQRIYGKFDVIIILETEGKSLGLMADEVQDVIPIPEDKAGEVPSYVGKINLDFIKFLCHSKDRIISVIDADHLFSPMENPNAIQ